MASDKKLFVGCLPYSKTEDDLRPIFEEFGPLQEIGILKKADGTSKGAAFVTYQVPESAAAAMMQLQNYIFPGSTRGINVSYSASAGAPKPSLAQARAQVSMQRPRPSQWGQQWPQQFGHQQPQYMQHQHYMQPQFGSQQRPPGGQPQFMMSGAQPSAPGTKVFVGQLPYSKNESDLWQLFGSIGPVTEVAMMMNSHTQQKKGAAFVRFQNAHAAEAAVAALDGFMFSGSPRPISVSIAQENGAAQGQKRSWSSAAAATIASMGQQAAGALSVVAKGHGKFGRSNGPPVVTKEGTKLFVGQLPFSRNESGIAEVFSRFGEVAEVYIHRDAAGQKKGGAFVRFFEPEHAAAALEMDGFLFEGATRPISVIFAGAEGGSKRHRAE